MNHVGHLIGSLRLSIALGAGLLLFQGCGVSGYNFNGSTDALNMSGGGSSGGSAGLTGVTGGSGGCTPGPIPSVTPGCDGYNNPDYYSCGNGNVWICHVPEGNTGNPQTLCVGLQAAILGHGVSFTGGCGGHGGDYPGKCSCDQAPTGSSGSSGSTGPSGPVLGV